MIRNHELARCWPEVTPARRQRNAVAKIWNRVILLRKRSFAMLKQDLIMRNPLRLLSPDGREILQPGDFGAVLARAGVGKTALVIQLALNTMLQNKNVLHISLNEPVGKVSLWYQEVLGCFAQQHQVAHIERLWETLAPHRFIMTFRIESFSAPILEERLTDLTSQNIFLPDLVLIDGLPFDDRIREALSALKKIAVAQQLPIWFTVVTHRHEVPIENGLPPQIHPLQDLFDVAIALQPDGDIVHIKALKGVRVPETQSSLTLDPATMLILNK
jgi:hypothetical protein